MKSLFYLLSLSLLFINCTSNTSEESVTIIGKWHDTHDYMSTSIDSVNGQTIVKTFPDIEITFFDNNEFTVEGEGHSFGIHSNGKWRQEGNIIDFYDTLDSLTLDSTGHKIYFYIKHKWEIVNHNAEVLDVNHFYEQDVFFDGDTLRWEYFRRFERVE